jgi:NADH:ubiquinone oxidoreductase subunit F (NADH-binding)
MEEARGLLLADAALKERGLSLGCGVLCFLGEADCGVCLSAKVMRYLASESSAQCGPCFFGLRALADACERVANAGSNTEDLRRLERWSKEVRGRGACHHPDGASIFLQSALKTFAGEFEHHPAHWRQR